MTALWFAAPTAVPLSGIIVGVVGCGLLLARPWITEVGADPTAALVVMFVGIGLAGALWPIPGHHPARPSPMPAALIYTGAGMAAFALGRLVGGGEAAVSATWRYLILNSLAAVAEEAFFRRLVYGVLSARGPVVAVVGSAAAFGLIHLTVWGLWALPLDLAAGLVLSWQRHASGRWSVPAATHVAANVLAVV